MLYFLVTFIALTAIRQWNPLFSPRAVIYSSDDSCLFTYPRHRYYNTATCAMYNSFPSLDLTLDDDLMGSIQVWHLYNMAAGHKTHNTGCMTHNAGRKTHNIGCMTHNTAGQVTQHTFVSSIQYGYCLMPGCMTSHLISVSSKWHHNGTTSYSIKNKLSYLSCQCHHIIIMPVPRNLSEKTENHTIVFKQ